MSIRKNTLNKYAKHRVKARLNMLNEFLTSSGIVPFIDTYAESTEAFTGPINKTDISQTDNDEYYTDQERSNKYGKKIEKFDKIIEKTGAKLVYVKSGSTGQTFKGIINFKSGEEFTYALKICAFPKCEKYGNYDNINRPENAEVRMLKLLSYFVTKNITPHLVLPYCAFDTNIKYFVEDKKLIESAKSSDLYKQFLKNHENGKFHKYVSVLMCEWANGGDFLDFIRKKYSEITPLMWKIFFFQIISVLATIQNKYPSFRHNDLKANNILVHEVSLSKKNQQKIYTISGEKYKVPKIKYQLKIWDFDFSCIPGVVDNSKVGNGWTKSLNITQDKNRYYDVHFFFLSLITFFNGKNIFPKEVERFIASILPDRLVNGKFIDNIGLLKEKDKNGNIIGTTKGKEIKVCYGGKRLLKNEEFVTPDDILKNNEYFAEFRTEKQTRDFYLNITKKNFLQTKKRKYRV